MRSTISVYNTALARLGGGQLDRINSPDEEGAAATLCRTLFPHVVELALSAHPWSFAVHRVVLAQKPGTGMEPPEHPFRYALPADCLLPVRLETSTAYTLEGGDLLAGASPAVLMYVARVLDPAIWSAGFADAVAWALAAELATALVNDARRQQFCMEKYTVALFDAAASDANSQNIFVPAGSWLASRE